MMNVMNINTDVYVCQIIIILYLPCTVLFPMSFVVFDVVEFCHSFFSFHLYDSKLGIPVNSYSFISIVDYLKTVTGIRFCLSRPKRCIAFNQGPVT